MLTTLRVNFKDPVRRRVVGNRLAGKMIGVAIVMAGIYALTSRANPEDKTAALRLLWQALKTGFGLDILDSDEDLDPIRSDPEFKRLVQNARGLHSGK